MPAAIQGKEELHGRAAAAWISGGMGAAFALLGASGAGAAAYALAACHALVTLVAIVAPTRTTVARAEQLIAGAATLTVSVAALTVPDVVLPVIPLGYFAGILIGAGFGSRAHAIGWVVGASAMYASSMWLRSRLGIVLPDWGAIGTVLLYLVPPSLFAAHVARSRGIAEQFRRALALGEIMQRKIARTNDELENARRRAEASNEAKSSFLANMSHELRTPLNAVIGYSELLLEEAEDRGAADMTSDLEKIRGAGRHLVSLVSDILDISKIEAGKMHLDVHDIELAPLVEDVRSAAQPLASKNDNELVVEWDEPVETVTGDATKLRQVLLNLLANACKFTNNGLVTLTVNPRGPDVTAGWLVLRVTDTGIGMSPEQQAKLFQAFTQGDESTTRRFGGTGLGLHLSQELCRLMGGSIHVESEEGVGSTFTIRVPRHVKGADSASRIDLAPVSTRSVPPVLIVDDDPDARDMIRRALSNAGYAVDEADNGQAALASLARGSASAIILDLEMPIMSGYELLDEIQAREELACIPVIVLTGTDPSRGVTARLRDQTAAILKKGGWTPHELVECVERHARRAELRCVEEAMRGEKRA